MPGIPYEVTAAFAKISETKSLEKFKTMCKLLLYWSNFRMFNQRRKELLMITKTAHYTGSQVCEVSASRSRIDV